jgi:O-antigen/teichoic acid export membrane protein
MVVRRRTDEAKGARPSFTASTLQTWGTNVGGAFLGLFNVLIVSRVLGPSGRGDFALLAAIAWLTSNLSTFGIQEANANVGAAEPSHRRALATNSVLFALVFGAASAALVATLVAVFPAVDGDSQPWLLAVTLGTIPVLILTTYLRFLVLAEYGFLPSNAAALITPVGNLVVNGLLAALGLLTVATAVLTWLGGQVIGAAVLAWYVAKRSGFGRPDARLAKRSLRFGLKSHAGRVMLLGNYRLDQWLLGAMVGSRELGLYSVAVAWAEALNYLPTSITLVQRPDLVRSSRRDSARQAARAFRAVMLIIAVLVVAVVLLAPFLCVTIFGEDFRGSIDDLRVLVLGAFGIVAVKQLGTALTAQNEPTLASIATGIAFVFTVALDLLLIPAYGGLGAASASTLAYSVGALVVAVFFVRALDARFGELIPRGGDARWFWTKARSTHRRPRAQTEEALVPPPGEEGV